MYKILDLRAMDIDEFRLNARKSICLEFIPVDDVTLEFEALQKMIIQKIFHSSILFNLFWRKCLQMNCLSFLAELSVLEIG